MKTTPAQRHKATAARSVLWARGASMTTRASSRHRAFSLIEVLLAIFILGVGVISIASLFPAGIAQQRQSVDDMVGPIVANNAISIIRSKIRPSDFGSFEDFGIATSASPRPTVSGDWAWIRPGFILTDDPTTTAVNEAGAIDIFSGSNSFSGSGGQIATEWGPSGYAGASPILRGVPYNNRFYASAPAFVFTRGERYYPIISQNGALDQGRPQYVWDCMFRKFQGKVLVAIFVYRVTVPGGANVLYSVAPNQSNPDVPPLPVHMNWMLAANSQWSAGGAWDAGGIDADPTSAADNSLVSGTAGGTAFDPQDQRQSWQEPRQWILDQNNNIHRVLGVSRLDDDMANDVEVELTRPVSAIPNIAPTVFYAGSTSTFQTRTIDVVTDVWYIPLVDGSGYTLTPVYATVKEL